MNGNALSFVNVDYSVEGTAILSGISFNIGDSEKACLAGPSGSGKSTLLRLVMGIILPTDGSIYIAGTPLQPDRLREVRQRMAYIDQEAVMGADTAEEALLLPFSFKANHNSRPAKESVIEVLKRVSLDQSILARSTGSISGGERQRLALARAMLLNKDIIITDEITSALDPENRRAVTRLLLGLDATVLAVSHDEEFQAEYDQVLELKAGRRVR